MAVTKDGDTRVTPGVWVGTWRTPRHHSRGVRRAVGRAQGGGWRSACPFGFRLRPAH